MSPVLGLCPSKFDLIFVQRFKLHLKTSPFSERISTDVYDSEIISPDTIISFEIEHSFLIFEPLFPYAIVKSFLTSPLNLILIPDPNC